MKRAALILMLAICTLGSQSAIAATSKSTSKNTATSKKSKSKSRSSHSGADFGLKRIGGAISMVGPEEIDATFGFGAFADLGTVAPRWGLEARLDYWSQSEDQFGFDTSVRDIVVGLRTKYDIEVAHPSIRPFVGTGLGMHFLSAEVEVPSGPGTTTVDDSETRVGLDFGGGIRTAVSPVLDLHAEGWYSVVSDANQFSLRVGMSYRLGL